MKGVKLAGALVGSFVAGAAFVVGAVYALTEWVGPLDEDLAHGEGYLRP